MTGGALPRIGVQDSNVTEVSPTFTFLVCKTESSLHPHADVRVRRGHAEESIAVLKFPLSTYVHLYSLSANVSLISLSLLAQNCSFF